jgi:hypothetical protein
MYTNSDFIQYCDYIIDGAYGSPMTCIRCDNPKRVYLNAEAFNWENEIDKLMNVSTKFELYYISDRPFSYMMFNAIRSKVIHIYATNSEVNHRLVTHIPNMIYDTHDMPIFQCQKDILCYMNFGMLDSDSLADKTAKYIRINCRDAFKDKTWVTYDNVIPRYVLYSKYARSHFSICPPGRGIDTTKVYEAAWYGCRPIVLHSPLDDLYRQFGSLIVDDWSDVTEELLRSELQYPINVNREIFEVDYWIKPYLDHFSTS